MMSVITAILLIKGGKEKNENQISAEYFLPESYL